MPKNKDLQGRDPSADSMAASGFLRFQKNHAIEQVSSLHDFLQTQPFEVKTSKAWKIFRDARENPTKG